MRSTTILGVRRGEKVAMGGDGQVTLDKQIMKATARKVRPIYQGRILVGFAGAVADAFTLFDRLETRLDAHHGNLHRAAVELAREWRTDRVLRRLEALLAAMDREHTFLISGTGEVIEPDDGLIGIGSGGGYAIAAARGLITHTDLPPARIVEESLRIAAGLCIYTNDHIVVEELA
ncbi:MAG: ATP-dependent protease subunit HslV [Candidatus Eisenbacteria bacterium]|nr:ATP-dependent protease subunit HslV [Candidatus Eisenbacteria bacterium]